MTNPQTPLAVITIPRYITEVVVAEKRRAKYHHRDKPGAFSKTILRKLESGDYGFNKDGYLVQANGPNKGQRIKANPIAAGTPRVETLSGNRFITGYASEQTRAKLVHALKDFYKVYLQQHFIQHGPITRFPLRVEWDVHTTLGTGNWDMSNLSFYWKYLEDALRDPDVGIIPDDNVLHVTHPPGPRLIPIEDWENRKFVIRFYHDDRDELGPVHRLRNSLGER